MSEEPNVYLNVMARSLGCFGWAGVSMRCSEASEGGFHSCRNESQGLVRRSAAEAKRIGGA